MMERVDSGRNAQKIVMKNYSRWGHQYGDIYCLIFPVVDTVNPLQHPIGTQSLL